MTQHQLHEILLETGTAAIAVSGGIDSLTLACIAAKINPDTVMFHALSPAVPLEATERVRRYAKDKQWQLRIVDAGEFADPDYLKNPINRCFYCKSNLYTQIANNSDLPIFSGTNLDDLDDFRPGLKAAQENQVRHPYVEALMNKEDIRNAARELGLADIAELSAAPCLSSRVTTGIIIDTEELRLIDRVETTLRKIIGEMPIRCRRLPEGYQVQIDANQLNRMDKTRRDRLESEVQALFADAPKQFLGIEAYTKGSAFVHGEKI